MASAEALFFLQNDAGQFGLLVRADRELGDERRIAIAIGLAAGLDQTLEPPAGSAAVVLRDIAPVDFESGGFGNVLAAAVGDEDPTRRLRGKLDWDGDVDAWRSARTTRTS